METVDNLIFDGTEAVRGRYHKRPDKNSICKYLMSLQKPKSFILKIGLMSYLNKKKQETRRVVTIAMICSALASY